MTVAFDTTINSAKFNFTNVNKTVEGKLINNNLAYWTFADTAPPTGKVYLEYYVDANNVGNDFVGLGQKSDTSGTLADGICLRDDNKVYINGTLNGTAGPTFTAADVIQIAYDTSAGKVWFGRNNTWSNGDPGAGTGGWSITLSGHYPGLGLYIANSAQNKITGRFASADFSYSPPSGFSAYEASSGAQDLAPSLLVNSNSFFAPTVAAGAVDLAPGLLSDGDGFFAATVASAHTLSPSLLENAQAFPASVVEPGAVDLAPGLLADADSFFAHAVSASADLAPSPVANDNAFFAPVVEPGAVDLAPGLLEDGENFFSPTVAGSGSQDLAPALLVNSNTFPEPVVTPGEISLAPPLLENAGGVFAPTVASLVTLAPTLLANDNGFFAATVAPGAVTIAPARLANDNVIHLPVVGSDLRVPTFARPAPVQVGRAAAVSATIRPRAVSSGRR